MPAPNRALLLWNRTGPEWLAALRDAVDNVIPPAHLLSVPPNGLVIRLRGNGNADFSAVAGVLFSVQNQHPGFKFVLLGTNPSFVVASP